MSSRNNRSLNMKPNYVKNSDFMSILYSKPLRVYKKPKFGIGDRIRTSKYDSLFRKDYKPQFTQEISKIVAIVTKKPPTYTITDEQEEVIRGNFFEKELIRVIWVLIHLQSSLFPTHLHSVFQTTRSVHLQISGTSEFGRTLGGKNFQDFLPVIVPKRYRGEIYILQWETLQNNRGLLSWTCINFSITDIVEAMNTLIQETNNHRDTCITIKTTRVTQKVKVYLANEESSLAIYSTDMGHIFGGYVRKDLGILMCGKGSHETTFADDNVRIHSLMVCTDIVEENCCRHKTAFAPLLSIQIQAQIWWRKNYWTIHELSGF